MVYVVMGAVRSPRAAAALQGTGKAYPSCERSAFYIGDRARVCRIGGLFVMDYLLV